MINAGTSRPHEIFQKRFRIKNLKQIYEVNLVGSHLKGVDRLNSYSFENIAKREIRIISRKSLDSTYKFAPYLELLKPKGRNKQPRVLAVPTVRDRIALHALKEVLFEIFPECVNRDFANSYIHRIKTKLSEEDSDISFFRTDIKNFYGSINRSHLQQKVKSKIRSKKILTMLERAITRPIVPKIFSKKNINDFVDSQGVPQGLSISNILAEIYLHDLDKKILNHPKIFLYSRYVDDILILAKTENLPEIVYTLIKEIEDERGLALTLNQSKTHTNSRVLDGFRKVDSFEYLGYQFNGLSISPKKSSEERFLRSIASIFCKHKAEVNKIKSSRKKESNKQQEIELLKKVLIFRLNERITGAISEKRKYGWIFYFLEINDISCLHRLDRAIARFFKERHEFQCSSPPSLKKIVRAYYEALHTPKGGYIHDYSRYRGLEEQRGFMIKNGYLEKARADQLSSKKVRAMFSAIKKENLSYLIQDETFVY